MAQPLHEYYIPISDLELMVKNLSFIKSLSDLNFLSVYITSFFTLVNEPFDFTEISSPSDAFSYL